MSVPYAADNSAGSNLGPTSKALIDRVKADAAKLQAREPVRAGAGRSRHDLGERARSRHHAGRRLFPGAARRQGTEHPGGRPQGLVEAHIEGRLFGIIGEPHVNVLKLNLALDALKKS